MVAVLVVVSSGVAAADSSFVLPVPDAAVMREFRQPAHRYAPGHRGVDLAASPGATVVSPGPGTVVYAGLVAGRPVMAIDHGDGLRSAVEPVAATIDVGRSVRAGQPVGVVGSGGHCAAGCVHWGVRLDGVYVDPMALVAVRVVLLPLSGRASSARGPW